MEQMRGKFLLCSLPLNALQGNFLLAIESLSPCLDIFLVDQGDLSTRTMSDAAAAPSLPKRRLCCASSWLGLEPFREEDPFLDVEHHIENSRLYRVFIAQRFAVGDQFLATSWLASLELLFVLGLFADREGSIPAGHRAARRSSTWLSRGHSELFCHQSFFGEQPRDRLHRNEVGFLLDLVEIAVVWRPRTGTSTFMPLCTLSASSGRMP